MRRSLRALRSLRNDEKIFWYRWCAWSRWAIADHAGFLRDANFGYSAGKVLVAHGEACCILQAGERPAVLIGKDTRISGYMLEAALEGLAAGVDVCLVGPIPTPAVAYLTRALRLQAGIVISASHNPDDNGIKFFGAGAPARRCAGGRDRSRLTRRLFAFLRPTLGGARRIDDAAGRYIEFCKSTFLNDLDLRGLKIVVDSAWRGLSHCAARFP